MKSICLLLSFAAFLTGCQNTPTAATPAAPDRFALADVNKDGKLTPEEVSNSLDGTIFSLRDKNKDGSLTAAESVGDELKDLKASDTNHDGSVTFAEYSAYARKSPARVNGFKEADANHDGTLDRAETQAYYAARE